MTLATKVGRVAGLLIVSWLAGCSPSASEPGSTRPEMLWTQNDNAGARMLPYADAEIAVFANGHGARLRAFDASTGAPRWTRDVPGGPGQFNLPFASIIGSGDVLLVPAWRVYALDRKSGAVRWTFETTDEYPAASNLAVEGDIVIAPGSLRRLYAVSLATGAKLWERDLGERPFGPTIDQGIAYLTTSGEIQTPNGPAGLGAGHALAVRVATGEVLWRAALPDWLPWRGGATKEGALTADSYIVASYNGRVYAFDRRTGATRWEYLGPNPFGSGVALLGSVAVVGAYNGDLIGLDVATGVERWKTSGVTGSVTEQITADGVCAYVSFGTAKCIDATGRIRWTIGGTRDGGPTFYTPVRVVGARLFAGSETGFHSFSAVR